MNGRQLTDALRKSLGAESDADLCGALGISSMTLHNWRNRKQLTPRIVAAMIKRLSGNAVTGSEIVLATRKKLDVSSLTELAGELGITNQAIQNWKNRTSVTPRQIAGLIASARRAVQSKTHISAIRPLVEFFPITKTHSKQRASHELFAVKDGAQKAHPYLAGLRKELETHHGVYIFFDSRGQAIYSGKARRQKLWKELNLAFNRDRDSLQKIRRIRHPARKQKYQTTLEKSRQIVEESVALHELASYFSAYQVVDGMIDVVESLLVRSFANDLLNKRMERFGQRSTTKRRPTKRRKKRSSSRE
jgi:hypothetical protein